MLKNETSATNLRMTVYCALFTALIIIGAYISIPIPISPVPITLADFFVMVAGLFLGLKYGLLSVLLYLGLGLFGMPVFSSGSSGFAVFLGPTGGFLLGYLLLVVPIGYLRSKVEKSSLLKDLIGILLGNVLLYAVGITWLRIRFDMSLTASIAAGLTPFIPGTVIKIIVVLTLGRTMRSRFKENMLLLK